MYYKMNGRPYVDSKSKGKALMQWVKDFEKPDRIMCSRKMYLGSLLISTIWLGLDHNWGFGKKPLIFETMVFFGGFGHDIDCERYSTKEDALKGQKYFVQKYKNPFTYAAAVFPIIEDTFLNRMSELWEAVRKQVNK